MKQRLVLLALGAAIIIFPLNKGIAQTTPPAPAWQARYNQSGSAYPDKIVTDAIGNTYVTGIGSSFGTSSDDFSTVKYDANGNQLWVARYHYGFDRPTGLAVDAAGNVVVTGSSSGSFATVKYDSAGNQLWVKRYGFAYNPSDDQPTALALDAAGNIYVTGFVCVWGSPGYERGCEDHDYATIKYAPDGTQLWLRFYDQGSDLRPYDTDKAVAMVVDGSGNVYVTGTSRSSATTVEAATIKYDTNGNELWVKREPAAGAGWLAVDGAGRLHLSDSRYNGVDFDLTVIKYDVDGTKLWERTYDNGYEDTAREIAVDATGNVYVAGSSQSNEGGRIDGDYVTLKYDANGVLLWSARYDNFLDAYIHSGATHLAVDGAGNVYVTGTKCDAYDRASAYGITCNGPLSPNVTVKYSPAGAQLWTVGGGLDLDLDGQGNLYVVGQPGPNNGDVLATKYPTALPTANFSFVSTSPVNIPPGGSGAYTITVTSKNSFSGSVALGCSVFPVTPTVTCSLSPSAVSLPGNGVRTSTLTVTTTSSTPLAGYTVTVTGQSGSQSASTGASLGVSLGDLAMTQLTPATTSIRSGDNASITQTVTNLGTAAGGAMLVKHHLSVNAVFGDADDVVDFASSEFTFWFYVPPVIRLIPPLAGGGSMTETFNLPFPKTVVAGNYYLCAKADVDGYVIESNEANNVLCTPVTVTRPDLVVTAVSAGAPAANIGAPLTVTATIANQGGAPPPGLVTVGLYLSTDNLITTADRLLTAVAMTPLMPGDSKSSTATVTIPSNVPAGVYYLGVIADPANGVIETDDTNNALAGSQITVTAGASDLVMTALSGPASGTAGGAITLSSTVANQGTGSPTRDFAVRFYLSTDASITQADIGLGNRTVGPLSAGGTNSGTTVVLIPAGLPPGAYYLGAIADPALQVPEGNEGNNVYAGSTITIAPGAQSFRPAAAWTARSTSSNTLHDTPVKVLTDGAGNVYLLAKVNVSGTGSDYDFVTLKYDASGALLWQAKYDTDFNTGGGETPSDLAVDPAGNVYVVGSRCVAALASGSCTDSQYVTIKYSSLGDQLWVRTFSDPSLDAATAIVLDQTGNLYVAGVSKTTVSSGSTGEFLTIKYDGAGNELWIRRAGPGSTIANVVALAMDQADNLYLFVARGTSPADYRIIKYDAAGNEVWTMVTDDLFVAAAVDGAGNSYVTGYSKNVTTNPRGYYTYKYDTDGNRVWAAYYAYNTVKENPTAIAVDGSGNVWVTGESWQGTSTTSPDSSLDYSTIKYDTNGTLQWTARYTRGNGNTPLDVAVDAAGNGYVTGRSHNGRDYDYATVKYDPEGNQLWEVRYDGAGSTAAIPASMDGGDSARSIALDGAGNVIIAGSSQSSAGDLDTATVKYVPSASAPLLPDLVMSALSTTTTYMMPGGTLPLANTVLNQGGAAAGPFVIAFHLSVDPVYGGADDIAFDYRTAPVGSSPASWRLVPGLGIGQDSAYTSSLTVPTTTPYGIYYLCALADVYNVSEEGVENNNGVCTASTMAVVSIPAITSVTPAQATHGVTASQAVTITGSGFVNGATITVGSLMGTTVASTTATATVPYAFASSTTLRFWWPNTALAPGAYNVTVTNPVTAGGLPVTRVNGFTVQAPQPTITIISPNMVAYGISASQPVTVYGTNFVTGATLTIGGLSGTTAAGTVASAATPFVFVNNGQLSVWWNNTSLAIGNYAVQVANPASAGGLSASLTGGFSVLASLPAETTRLTNISTRAYVGTGANQTIAGFIITGTTPKTVYIKGQGPSMSGAPFNVPGTLTNPYITIYSMAAAAVIASQDNWQTAPTCTTGFACSGPPAGKDPCQPNPGQTVPPPGCTYEVGFQITLPPGAYTATIAGFIITGTTPKTVYIKGQGPSMSGAPFNVPGTLANPYITIYSMAAGAVIASQDDWQTAPTCTTGFACSGPPAGKDPCQPNPGQTVPPPGCTYEVGFQITLPPGAYTAACREVRQALVIEGTGGLP
ncbi:MAG: SBBP repeat-containing protein [Nitrospirae bacterium]|nr:SBBP repeat-containing protein [Nitrospirota bacterium]